MDRHHVAQLRHDLGLSQAEFGQLFGVHAMTVSRWERGLLAPSAYQGALMAQFRATADEVQDEQARQQAKALLVSAGVVAALVWLLGSQRN